MNDSIQETKRSLRCDRAFWQRVAVGVIAASAIGSSFIGLQYERQRRCAKQWEYYYSLSESTKDAALAACGELSDRVEELEAYIALHGETVQYEPENIGRYAPITSEERELLARLVWLEARGEPFEGQQAVAEVVLNRVAAENFPGTVAEVINQEHQFTPAAQIPGVTPTEAQYQAVDAALYGENVLPIDVVYFSVEGENESVWGEIGGHVFCYQYEGVAP